MNVLGKPLTKPSEIGPGVTQGEWESGIERALADQNDRWVVRETATIPVKSFHGLDDAGELSLEPFYVVMGIAASHYELRCLCVHRRVGW
jgi:hypothetical protein